MAGKIGFVSEKARRHFSALLPWRLTKSNAWSASVLVDELDSGRMKGSTECDGFALRLGVDDVQGVIQTDQLRNLCWEKRGSRFICSAPAAVLHEVRAKLKPLLSLQCSEPETKARPMSAAAAS